MTWGRWTRIVLDIAVFCFLAHQGAAALSAGVWPYAAVVYALALVFAYAVLHEWQTAAAHAEAVDDHRPTPPTSRAHARILARRALVGTCACDRWWTSLGTDHDPTCPTRTGTPHATGHHPRPLPRRRAAPAARRRRRQRPR